MKLLASETDLVGRWRLVDNAVSADENCTRIARLIEDQLTNLGTDPTGWDTLYRDPADGRYWELTFPESDFEGGGPPRLTCINEVEAMRKYGL
jgi:hypothetical protein